MLFFQVTFKLQVVERAIECGDTVRAAREFNVDRHCVAAWRKKEAALRNAVAQIASEGSPLAGLSALSSAVRKRLAGGGRKQVHPLMDARVVDALAQEADRLYDPSVPPEARIIKPSVAMELAIPIAKELGVSDRFTASAGWLSRFCERNRLRLKEANVVVRRKKDE